MKKMQEKVKPLFRAIPFRRFFKKYYFNAA
jgi:hypothetical protein